MPGEKSIQDQLQDAAIWLADASEVRRQEYMEVFGLLAEASLRINDLERRLSEALGEK